MSDLHKFIKLAKYAGERFDLTQGGGGNVSVKLPKNAMLIKASGFLLSDVEINKGFCKVNNLKVKRILRDKQILSTKNEKKKDNRAAQLLQRAVLNSKKTQANRPSIETFFHSFLPKYTLHIHPIAAMGLLCQRTWRKKLKRLFPEALLVDYKKPGIEIALEVYKKLGPHNKQHSKSLKIIFLQNHGLIISSDNFEEVIPTNELILKTIEQSLNIHMDKFKLVTKVSDLINSFANTAKVAYLSTDAQLNRLLKRNRKMFFSPPCFPDKVVYCGLNTLEISDLADKKVAANYIKKYSHSPNVIIYKNNIFFIARNLRRAKEIEEIFKCHVMILSYCSNTFNFLTKKEIKNLTNFEAEIYRQKLQK